MADRSNGAKEPHTAERDKPTRFRDDVRSEVEKAFAALGLLDLDPVSTGLALLDERSLPERLGYGTLHGDFHVKNLLATDEGVAIIDWEQSRSEYLIDDFFSPFVSLYVDTGKPGPYTRLVDGGGRAGEIARKFATILGPTVYRSNKASASGLDPEAVHSRR